MKEFMKSFANKLKSRKFLLCLAIVIVGICMSMGITESEIQQIAGMISSTLASLVYIISEASVDKASLNYKAASANLEAKRIDLSKDKE